MRDNTDVAALWVMIAATTCSMRYRYDFQTVADSTSRLST